MEKQFKAVEWAIDTNIYEVNLRQYTIEGTFQAFSRELPRLRDMGVETLWFMPVTPISKERRLGSLGSYYACSDYTAVNPEFGSLEDFKNLVGNAHLLGFKVLIDWVANHTGWDHRWTKEHPDFYRRNHNGQFFDQHGWEDVIDLNYDNPEVWKKMVESMRFWVEECDIDGFRCDMAMLVPLDFWRTARMELDQSRKLFWLAECEEISYHQVFDATYTWKWLHKMEAFWNHQTDIDGLDEVLNYYSTMFPADALRLLFTTNHDENSHSGSEFERLGDAALPFSVLCSTWNGIPLIYSGQELPNKKRLKFFDKDFIKWTGKCELHDFYKKLLTLRKHHPALRAGDPAVSTIRVLTDDSHFVFAFLRRYSDKAVLVALNLSAVNRPQVNVHEEQLTGNFVNLFTNSQKDFGSEKTFNLGPWGYQVFYKK